MRKQSRYTDVNRAERRFESVSRGLQKVLNTLVPAGVNNGLEAHRMLLFKLYPYQGKMLTKD